MTISSSTKYIDTGISWIGTIPSDWQMVSLKSIAWVILGKMRQDKPASKEDTLEKYLCAKDVHLDGINWYEPKEMYFSPKEKRALLVKDGDLLIVEGGAGAGGAYVAKNPTTENFYVQNSINIVRAHKCVLPQYLYYWVNKLVTNGYVEVVCNVATIPHFTKEKVSSIQIPLPSLDVQQRIVSYLDFHISSIDKRMSLLATKRDLYLRLKTAIINRAVTQGLNPDVKMKDSGVEWIGVIPEHWEVKRMKDIFSTYSTGLTPESKDWTNFSEDERYTWITIGDMDSKVVNISNMCLSEKVIKEKSPIISPKGSLLFSFKLSIGKTAFAGKDLYTNEAIVTIPPRKAIDLNYFYYLIPKVCLENATENIYGAKMLNQKIIANMLFAIPSFSEQQAISTYLDKKCAKIDAIVENLNQQIEKHKLLKRALINEVITGQRAV